MKQYGKFNRQLIFKPQKHIQHFGGANARKDTTPQALQPDQPKQPTPTHLSPEEMTPDEELFALAESVRKPANTNARHTRQKFYE